MYDVIIYCDSIHYISFVDCTMRVIEAYAKRWKKKLGANTLILINDCTAAIHYGYNVVYI
jgi:hypothetical protein